MEESLNGCMSLKMGYGGHSVTSTRARTAPKWCAPWSLYIHCIQNWIQRGFRRGMRRYFLKCGKGVTNHDALCS